MTDSTFPFFSRTHSGRGVAVLSVRVGRRLVFSAMRPAISGPGTPAFERLKRLAAETVAHLSTAGTH